jgi:hypothetical protein
MKMEIKNVEKLKKAHKLLMDFNTKTEYTAPLKKLRGMYGGKEKKKGLQLELKACCLLLTSVN